MPHTSAGDDGPASDKSTLAATGFMCLALHKPTWSTWPSGALLSSASARSWLSMGSNKAGFVIPMPVWEERYILWRRRIDPPVRGDAGQFSVSCTAVYKQEVSTGTLIPGAGKSSSAKIPSAPTTTL